VKPTAPGPSPIEDRGFFSARAKIAVDEFAAARPITYELILPHPFAGHFAIRSKEGRRANQGHNAAPADPL
jgi:hypothetical protein